MDFQRLILFFVFSFSVFLLLDGWQRDQSSPPAAKVSDKAKTEPSASPATATPSPGEALKAGGPVVPKEAGAPRERGRTIRVETDLVIAEIAALGGELRRLELKQHRDTVNRDAPFVLFDAAAHSYTAQSGLTGGSLPNHHTLFEVDADRYRLADGQAEVEVKLRAPEVHGVAVTKSYRFRRGSYLVDVSFEIANKGAEPVQPFAYFQLVRDGKAPAGDSAMVPTYTGIAIYTDKEKFHKVTFDDVEKGKAKFPKSGTDGWIAIIQHYFLAAWLPKAGTPREFYMNRLDGPLYAAGVIVPAGIIAGGSSASVVVPLYAGPEEPRKLEAIAPGLDLTVDYGILTVLAVPLFWLLEWLHRLAGNWGVAIILLTIIIKLAFYPLSAASYRSMARMRVVAPKLQRIKDQYGADRQRMQQAMMELYKSERINPLGGCMPILVQIPVFIALYWVLLASVELRHAPFMLWIDDLATPDPWFVLPLLMGATMIIQTRLNPEPPDPVQAKVMKIMPVVFSVFFFFFPAGLVLYWLVNNVLSIAQQWHITRTLEREAAAATRKR
ncbi:MAG: membrane protein insertase YidC [Burkholderiales bacterium]|nr:membrane protein insertase YidC [Burkholderiales bacterium]